MFSIYLLGSARIEGPDGRLGGTAAQRHRIALLAYLATARGNTAPREKLLALLWPEQGEKEARHLLNVSVHALRKALGETALDTDGGEIRLNTQVVTSDVQKFREARTRGDLAAAIEAYGGPFLDGFFLDGSNEFEQWQSSERAKLATEMEEALQQHAEDAERVGNWRQAVACWRRLADVAGDRAFVTLRLMRALDATGDRAAAIQAADAHAELLRREFGAEPSADVLDLAARLRNEPSAVPVGVVDLSMPERAVVMPDVSRWGKQAKLVPAAAAAIVLAALGIDALKGGSAPPAAPLVQSIAVLPFVNAGGDSTDDYLSDGIADELTTALAIPGLRVMSRSSAFAFKGRPVSAQNIGESLRVTTVLEGQLRRSGTQLIVTAQLVNVADGLTQWRKRYERELKDVAAIQQDIATAIANELKVAYAPAASRLQTAGTDDPMAHDLYLQGLFEANRRTPHSVRRAMTLLQQAIARDSGYALAWVALADAHVLSPEYADVPRRLAFPRAEAAAMRALSLDSTLAEAHATLITVKAVRFQWEEAEKHFMRAIALRPDYARAYHWYCSDVLRPQRRMDSAQVIIRKAMALDPAALALAQNYGINLVVMKRYDEAIAFHDSVAKLNPESALARLNLAESLFEAGDHARAAEEFMRTDSLRAGSVALRLAHLYAVTGRRALADSIIRAAERRRRTEYVQPIELAAAYLAVGNRERALVTIGQGIDEFDAPEFAAWNAFEPLRSDPRYQALLKRARLAQ